jgi:hypothetical protein
MVVVPRVDGGATGLFCFGTPWQKQVSCERYSDDAAETNFAHEGFPLPVSLQKIGRYSEEIRPTPVKDIPLIAYDVCGGRLKAALKVYLMIAEIAALDCANLENPARTRFSVQAC